MNKKIEAEINLMKVMNKQISLKEKGLDISRKNQIKLKNVIKEAEDLISKTKIGLHQEIRNEKRAVERIINLKKNISDLK